MLTFAPRACASSFSSAAISACCGPGLAPAALAGDDFPGAPAARAYLAHHDWLDYSLGLDRFGELVQLVLAHGPARLVAAGGERVDRQGLQGVARARLQRGCGLGRLRPQQ